MARRLAGVLIVVVVAASAMCASMAGAAGSHRVLVAIAPSGEAEYRYRPHFFVLSADGAFSIVGIRWLHYGGRVATGRGTASMNDCLPTCVAGHRHRRPAKVRLTRVILCEGHYIYARLHYSVRGSLPKNGYRHRGAFSMLPTDEYGTPLC